LDVTRNFGDALFLVQAVSTELFWRQMPHVFLGALE